MMFIFNNRYRTSFLNPSVKPFNPQQRDIKSQVVETNTAATETLKEIENNIKNKATKEDKEPTNWATPIKTFQQKKKTR